MRDYHCPFAFDYDDFFNSDYIYFYEVFLTEEVNNRDAALITQLLHLQPGMRVLDLACGYGRIAQRLAALGCKVTGLDRSAFFLDWARSQAVQKELSICYIEGDMRSLPWTEQFECVIMWGTAFGYFSDEDNRQVVGEVYRALLPGGRILVEHPNRDVLLRHFQLTSVTERDGNCMIDRHQYDIPTWRFVTERTIIRECRVRRCRYSYRLFSYPELQDWLGRAGFSVDGGFSEDGRALQRGSRSMIVVAHK